MLELFKKSSYKEEIIPAPQGPNPELALKVIKKAKENFKRCRYYEFMCPSMLDAYHSEVKDIDAKIRSVRQLIPEFNPEFLGGEDSLFWWDPTDKKSRIQAFDKLIKIYSKKL